MTSGSWPHEGPYAYDMSGLKGLHLLGGVTRHADDGYGEGISIEDVDGLHAAVLRWVSTVRRPLTGAEARFVRSHVERSPAEMAGMLGMTDAELLAMEGARNRPVPGPVDRLVRLVALDASTEGDEVTHDLERIAGLVEGPGSDRVAVFAREDGVWKLHWTGAAPPWTVRTGTDVDVP